MILGTDAFKLYVKVPSALFRLSAYIGPEVSSCNQFNTASLNLSHEQMSNDV